MVFVDFLSDPTGARVYWDGSYIGTTFINDYQTTSGRHNVVMKKSGYEDWEDTIYIDPKTLVTWIRAVLIPVGVETGEVRFTSEPSYAKITFDNEYIGKTPETERDLAPGKYYWIYRKDGYEMKSGSVTVYSGKRTTIHRTLKEEEPEPTTGQKIFRVVEKTTEIELAADFYVDGVYQGVTPKTLTLDTGTHQLKVTLTGYKDYSTDFNVVGGVTGSITVVLEKVEPLEYPKEICG